MQDAEQLEKLFRKSEAEPGNDAISWEFHRFIIELSEKENFIRVFTIALRSAYDTSNFERALYIIRNSGMVDESPDYQALFLLMMDFILDKLESAKDVNMKESILEATLDLFWHQHEGLENLDANGQDKLKRLLNFAATYRNELTGSRDGLYEENTMLFHAIKKSMDLIKFQKEFGNSPALIDLYINHYDKWVAQRAIEFNNKGWL